MGISSIKSLSNRLMTEMADDDFLRLRVCTDDAAAAVAVFAVEASLMDDVDTILYLFLWWFSSLSE